MVTNPFEKALEFVFKWEGFYSNDKDDPGGETKYGVTLAALKQAGLDLTKDGVIDGRDIKKLDIETAVQIYKNDYWFATGLSNDLDWRLSIVAFDTAVNVGPTRTKRWLNDTISREKDWRYFLNLRVIHYMNIIKKNPRLSKFKRGWMNRVGDLKMFIEILEREDEH